ncbi:MAG: hypothetical protein K6F62_05770 [Schwartzia sp.]|nr:hypothetical protein [Schwartzia sp. (in: firmicutes)]
MSEKKLNENKICFISCVNNDEQYNKCLESWKALRVPEGMTVESVVIHDAKSMTEGYQAGMKISDAKYKIYVHQDVWINSKNFLHIMVEAFKKHPEYGILGVVGSKSLPTNGIWWEGEKIGSIRDRVSGDFAEYLYDRNDRECVEAIALDGLILMTQYDIPWRADVFTSWHFYDVSQCMEFLKQGYKAAVLPQSLPLCDHYAKMNTMKGYDEERTKFLKEYLPFLRSINCAKGNNGEKAESVVIVIPVYKKDLEYEEKISLRQLNSVLGRYPRVFIAPESLEFDYGILGDNISVERFADHWFQSVTSYSCLMMQKEYYERFSKYEYMLVYQLDVFVFSDRLKEFCDKGYDYIGAPVGKFVPFWHAIDARVGNGGFSLRRIPAHLRVLNDFDRIVRDTPFFPCFILAEDVFFGYCGKREDVEFTVADFKTASEFSVQENVCHVYSKFAEGWRPFGCHGWSQVESDFWWPLIAAYGYEPPEKIEKLTLYTHAVLRDYIKHRNNINLQPSWGWIRRGEKLNLEKFWKDVIEKYPEGNPAWERRLEEMTCFWCAVIENVNRGHLSKDTDREPFLIAVYRAMKSGEAAKYLWEMWDMMLPILGREPYSVKDVIIKLVLEKKLEKFVEIELGKIDKLLCEKGQMTEKQYSIESQVRMRAGQKLFEKAIAWNISTETELWKRYGAEVIKL